MVVTEDFGVMSVLFEGLETEALEVCERRRGCAFVLLLRPSDESVYYLKRRYGSGESVKRMVAWYEEQGSQPWDWRPKKVVILDRKSLLVSRQRDKSLLVWRRYENEEKGRRALGPGVVAAVLFLEDGDREIAQTFGDPRLVEDIKKSVERYDAGLRFLLRKETKTPLQFRVEPIDEETRKIVVVKGLEIRAPTTVSAERVVAALFENAAAAVEKYGIDFQKIPQRALRSLQESLKKTPREKVGFDKENSSPDHISSEKKALAYETPKQKPPCPLAVFTRVSGLPEGSFCCVKILSGKDSPQATSRDTTFVSGFPVFLTKNAKLVISIHDRDFLENDTEATKKTNAYDETLEASAELQLETTTLFGGALKLVTLAKVEVATIDVKVCVLPLDAALASLLTARPINIVAVERRVSKGCFLFSCASADWEPQGYYKDSLFAAAIPSKDSFMTDLSFEEMAPLQAGEAAITPWQCRKIHTDAHGWQYKASDDDDDDDAWRATANSTDQVRRRSWTRLVSTTPTEGDDLKAIAKNATFFAANSGLSSNVFSLSDRHRDDILSAYLLSKDDDEQKRPYFFVSERSTCLSERSTMTSASPWLSYGRLRDESADAPCNVESPREFDKDVALV